MGSWADRDQYSFKSVQPGITVIGIPVGGRSQTPTCMNQCMTKMMDQRIYSAVCVKVLA